MRTEILTRWPEISALASEWNRLLHRSRADTLFLTWEWLQAWRDVTADSARPFVVTVRNANNDLVGLAPFYLTRIRLLDGITFRTLRIVADHATGSEYGDWVADPEVEASALSAIAARLHQERDAWDLIWMPRMASWNGATERITAACDRSGLLARTRRSDFSLIELPGDMHQFEQGFSAQRRQQLRRARRKLLGSDGVSVVRCESQAELARFLDALFDLHYRRWQTQGQLGCFRRKPLEAEFYRRFTTTALEHGWLWLVGLADGGEFKAVQIGYQYRNHFLQMQEGFDPDYVRGVGNVLRTAVIERCIDAGLTGYDFLGGISEHKQRWGAIERHGHNLLIAHPGRFMNRLLHRLYIWPTGRFLRELDLLDGN